MNSETMLMSGLQALLIILVALFIKEAARGLTHWWVNR